ncbi:ABC transporter permease [uncultured Aureimonas sp.]|uniref:ABC transporter permease n=1 Tax=uncultured Aureimonas sp. TaxID=1604662 RepID=UPI0025D0C242|nr:ABC transporter permease [uncultured Aureimonas sp.]
MRKRRNLRLTAGLAIVAPLVAAALVAPFWTPSAAPLRLRLGERLEAPFAGGLLGTDQLGRDVLSLLMLGAGNSLATAATAILIAAILGAVVGLIAAETAGRTGSALMRGADVLFAFPPLLSAMMLAAALGTGFWSATTAIALFTLPVFARVTRSTTASVLARDFVAAARALGRSGPAIARHHVLPNIAGVLAIQISLQMGLAILTEAGLGYLGLGRPPPTPSWGRMLADAQTYMASAPWLALAPGAAIALAVLGFNLIGDGLRDRLDPRARR